MRVLPTQALSGCEGTLVPGYAMPGAIARRSRPFSRKGRFACKVTGCGWSGTAGGLPLMLGARARYAGRSLAGSARCLGGGRAIMPPSTDTRGVRFGIGSTGFLDQVDTYVPLRPRTLAVVLSWEG